MSGVVFVSDRLGNQVAVQPNLSWLPSVLARGRGTGIMLNRIHHWLAPPIFEGNEEKTRLAWQLNVITLVMLAGATLYTIIFPILAPQQVDRLVLVLPVFIVLLGVLALTRRAQVLFASGLLVMGQWLVLMAVAAASGGVRAPGYTGEIVIVFCAGILLGPRAALGLAGISIVAGAAMVYAETHSLLPPLSAFDSPTIAWAGDAIFFVVAAGFLRLATRSIRDSLARAQSELTERRRAEESLRESNARLRAVIENVPFDFWVMNNEGRYVIANRSSQRNWGNALVGKRPEDLGLSEEILAQWQRHNQRAFAGAVVQGEEEYLIDGNKTLFQAIIAPVRDGDKTLGILGVNIDITARKQAEEALRESEARFRSLFENMLEGFAYCQMLFDEQDRPADFVYLDVNSAFERLTGLKDVVGKRVTEVIPGIKESDSELFEIYARVALTGRPERFELDFKPLMAWLSISVYSTQKGYFIAVFDNITERKRAEGQIYRQLQHLTALHTIDTAITGAVDLRVTLNVFLEQTTAQLGVDAAAILLFHPSMQTLEYAAERGWRSRLPPRTLRRLDQSLAGQAVLERRLVHLEGAALRDKPSSLDWAGEEFVSYYSVPLIAKGQVKGVLEVFHRTRLNPDSEWLRFLETLATQAAIAIDNMALFGDLERSNQELTMAYDTTLEGWSRALDLRDRETEGHTRRVTDVGVRLARALGMPGEALTHFYRGALLHDIGKMGIPDRILLKPGPLTDAEWQIMRQHPVYAYDLLSPIDYLRPAVDIPYCHHEKWDGAGYPRGRAGEQIPLAARIFAVVDVWDALRSDRPYRNAWSNDQVRAYLREQTGSHFDPKIVEVFLSMERELA